MSKNSKEIKEEGKKTESYVTRSFKHLVSSYDDDAFFTMSAMKNACVTAQNK
jgi:hypothetical protein